MRMRFFTAAWCCLLIITAAASALAADASSGTLYLQGRHFDPLAGEDGAATSGVGTTEAAPRAMMMAAPAAASGDAYYIIQFTGPVQAAWKADLAGRGVVLFDYVPQNAFIAKADASLEATIGGLDFVRWIGDYEPEYRLSQNVYEVSPDALDAAGGSVELQVLAFPGEDAAALRAAVEGLGGTVRSVTESGWGIRLRVAVPITSAEDLQDVPGIKWIEPAPEHRTQNNVGTDIIQARGVRDKVWTGGGKLYGEGQVVAVCDSGLDTGVIASTHEDFWDGAGSSRIAANVIFSGASTEDTSGHGTHVAGIIAGNGSRSGSNATEDDFPDTCFAGVAPKATLYVQSVGASDGSSRLPGIPSDLSLLFQPARDAGARMHSNSWGSAGSGSYDSESLAVDQFMWDNKDFLILYAGGNGASDTDHDGVMDRYSLDTPGTAKNCLTVGASESLRSSGGYSQDAWSSFGHSYGASPVGEDTTSDRPDGMAAFSSRGPTQDGRWKPEIVAPGTNIISTRSSRQVGNGWGAYDDYYYYSGGSSMATPMVAGAAALMREYLIDEESIASPSAALVKAGLIHGATDLNPGQYGEGAARELADAPEPSQGWGRINLLGSMDVQNDGRVVFHDVTSSAPADNTYLETYSFTVADDGQPFRATLSWTDYPGTPAAEGGLVNDLDLRVRKPDAAWVYPDNARNLSSLDKVSYYGAWAGTYGGDALALRLTASSYPTRLESVALGFSNSSRVLADVDIVVYDWDGAAIGAELFRKRLAYIPHGERMFQVGLDVARDVVVAVEETNANVGIMYSNGNTTGRAFERTGSGWTAAGVTPFLVGCFREQVAATSFDHVNNTVTVTIASPAAGTYTAEVSAYNIPHGPQPYALVMSGLASAVATSGSGSIQRDPVQPAPPTMGPITTTRTTRSLEDVNRDNGSPLTEIIGDEVTFRGTITGNYGQGLVSMRYGVTGLPARAAGDLALVKLLGFGRSLSFTYPKAPRYEEGNWWLTEADGTFVDPQAVLDPADTYYVVSVVKDNGSYDTDNTLNVVEDPQVLGIGAGGGGSGVAGGGGGGCVVALEGGSDVSLVLVLLASALALWRARRRE